MTADVDDHEHDTVLVDAKTDAKYRHPADVVISEVVETDDGRTLSPSEYGLTGHCQGQAGGHAKCAYHRGRFFGEAGNYSPGFVITPPTGKRGDHIVLGDLVGTWDPRKVYRCPCTCHEYNGSHMIEPVTDPAVRHQVTMAWFGHTDRGDYSAVAVCSCGLRHLEQPSKDEPTVHPVELRDRAVAAIGAHARLLAPRRVGHVRWGEIDETHNGETFVARAWCVCGARFERAGFAERNRDALIAEVAGHIEVEAARELDRQPLQLGLFG